MVISAPVGQDGHTGVREELQLILICFLSLLAAGPVCRSLRIVMQFSIKSAANLEILIYLFHLGFWGKLSLVGEISRVYDCLICITCIRWALSHPSILFFFFIPSYTANRMEFYCTIVWLSVFCDTECILYHHISSPTLPWIH